MQNGQFNEDKKAGRVEQWPGGGEHFEGLDAAWDLLVVA